MLMPLQQLDEKIFSFGSVDKCNSKHFFAMVQATGRLTAAEEDAASKRAEAARLLDELAETRRASDKAIAEAAAAAAAERASTTAALEEVSGWLQV